MQRTANENAAGLSNKVETAVHDCNSWLSVFPLSFLGSISLASLFSKMFPTAPMKYSDDVPFFLESPRSRSI